MLIRSSDPVVNTGSISTLIESCLCFQVGPVDRELLAALESHGYDQAPVLDGNGKPLGLVAVAAARALLADGLPITLDDADIDRPRSQLQSPLGQVLHVLSDAGAVLVDDDNGKCYGLLTISDLNRHSFRSVLYGVFAELEALMARLVDVSFVDPWRWLETLSEDVQARLIGYWKLAEKRNVDIGPLAGCTLTELLKIVAASPDVRDLLRCRSRNQFEKLAGSLPEFRNRVMHPVRPLVLGKDDVTRMSATMDTVQELIARVRAALSDRGLGSRVHWL